MRKITAQTVQAFNQGRNFKSGNMEVIANNDITQMFLHGNKIAEYKEGEGLKISNGGWSSNTTKERLNALPNVYIYQKNFQWFLNGTPWNGEWANPSTFGKEETV